MLEAKRASIVEPRTVPEAVFQIVSTWRLVTVPDCSGQYRPFWAGLLSGDAGAGRSLLSGLRQGRECRGELAANDALTFFSHSRRPWIPSLPRLPGPGGSAPRGGVLASAPLGRAGLALTLLHESITILVHEIGDTLLLAARCRIRHLVKD